MRNRIPSLALTALAVAALPASAQATDRYVSKSGSDSSMTCAAAAPCLTIGRAFLQGQSGDTIRIGPGTFDSEGKSAGNETFHIVGAGAGTAAAFDPAAQTEIKSGLLVTADGSSVRQVRIDGSYQSALRLISPGGPRAFVVEDVVLIGGTSVNAFPALEIVNDSVQADVRRAVAMPAPNTNNAAATRVQDATARFADSTVRSAAGPGLIATAGANVTLTRSTVSGRGSGVSSDNSNLVVERSRIDGVQTGLAVEGVEGSSVTVTDSLIALTTDGNLATRGVDILSSAAGKTNRVTLRRSTVLAQGPEVKAGIVLQRDNQGEAALTLESSVVHAAGAGTPDVVALDGSGTATASATHSSFSDVGGVPMLQPGSGTNVAGDPMLAADGSPQTGSPLIDRGDTAALPAGALDLVGAPRAQDGDGDAQCSAIADIGAFERAAAACTLPGTGGGSGSGGGGAGGGPKTVTPTDTVAPALSGVGMTHRLFAASGKKRGTAFRWTLSEAAAVTIKIEKSVRKGGRARWVAVGDLTAAGAAGANTLRFSGRVKGRTLKPGRYRAVLGARDAAGNAGTAPAVAFRVRRAG